MSGPQRDFWYWSEPLVCITGEVSIDRREIAAVVVLKDPTTFGFLDVHLKSGTIFTLTKWDKYTLAHLISMVELEEDE
jgi:hypothetical protein